MWNRENYRRCGGGILNNVANLNKDKIQQTGELITQKNENNPNEGKGGAGNQQKLGRSRQNRM